MIKRLLLLLCLLPGIALSQQYSDYQLSNEANPLATNVIPGGWSLFRSDLSMNEYFVFSEALRYSVGVKYTPIAVSTQVVAGTNYRFICNGEPVAPGAAPTAVVINIHQSLHGDPKIMSINDIQ
ncbi:hypothetical protein [Spartinivicinus ruber]|uniref:hypothetical protein n=1 Tax=Spartinivicinus ruber TaxID=2683272 RepID=UPI0013D36DCF|nr:hypothetical protein [Spartinivicinus ruber]